MKAIKLPSLFFYLAIFSVLQIYSQKRTDSLLYYRNLATNSKNSADLAKAYIFYDNDKEERIKDKDILGAVYDLRFIASLENRLGLLLESEKSSIKAITLLENIKDSHKIEPLIGIYNHLGMIYKKLGNYTSALHFYDKALELSTDLKHRVTIINNKSNIYKEKGDLESAFKMIRQAYVEVPNLNDEKVEARILSNLGVLQSKLDIPDALKNLEKALDIRKKLDHVNGIYTSYEHLYKYFKDRKKMVEASYYAEKAYNYAKSKGKSELLNSALSNMIELNMSDKLYKYKKVKDSIEKNKRSEKDNFLYFQYEISKKEKKLQKIEFQRTKILYAFIFFMVLSIFIYFLLKSKNKKKTLQAVYKTESYISKKVHDEVSNDVFQIMTTLQSNTKINDKVIDDLDTIYNKTRNIAKEHSVINYRNNFNNTLNDLLLNYSTDDVNVIVKDAIKVNWKEVSKLKKETIYKVLQELMVNMTKHSKAGVVVLSFKQKRKKIQIIYSDDGVGTTLKKSTGLQNVENRIKTINGTITFDSKIDKGFKAIITV